MPRTSIIAWKKSLFSDQRQVHEEVRVLIGAHIHNRSIACASINHLRDIHKARAAIQVESDSGWDGGNKYNYRDWSDDMTLGARDGAAPAFVGDIGEVIVYRSDLVPAQMDLITEYLMNKWLVAPPSQGMVIAVR